MRDHVLTRHFLQRFLDNDLISPDADRHQILAVVCAALITSGLFVTVLLSLKYLFRPFQSPGWTAVVALDDRFLYIACSMIVMALVAVAEWDALVLDARDTSILGPLPIPRGVIVRAKLAALVLFATAFAVALNLVPSVLHPSLLATKLPVGVFAVMTLIAFHAAITMAAGAFGFLSVLGLRELLHVVLGTAWFSRVSTVVQACLVVFFATTFLLLPGLSSGVARSWLAPGALTPYAVPPLWFVGLHETLAGNVIDGLPRGNLPPRILESENEATVLYRSQRLLFHELGGVAIAALGLAVLVAVAAYAWNSRRAPGPPIGPRTGRSRVGAMFVWVAQRFVVRRPVVQAGFFFTLQTLSRSVPHRLSVATSVAVGLAMATVSLRGVEVRQAVDVASMPLALLAVQTVLVTVLLAGVRHAVRVPAELRANWTFHLSWAGDERPYLVGVKRAALVGLGLPTLLALFPLYALVLGARLAFVHFVCGLLVALVLLEVLWLGFRKLPFASSYVPSGNLKSLGPIYALAFLLTTYGLAWVERLALGNTRDTVAFLAAIATLLVSTRAVDLWQRRIRTAIELDELPTSATQRFDLSG